MKETSTLEDGRLRINFKDSPSFIKFDQQFPIYNWLYPFDERGKKLADPFSVFTRIEPRSRLRALYFHVPFCDTICSFCPFTRGNYDSQSEVDRFVQALLREIEIKHQYPAISSAPVDTIYFGGGTPSVLGVDHFHQLGEAIHRFFDLSQLKEFTMECEVKSVTQEKLKAWKEIGVTRISFGVQTFNPLYRQLFNMTATVEQIRQVAEWSNGLFSETNVDMIVGIAGQSLDDLLDDVEQANALNMTTIDYYTLNNIVAQTQMHRAFTKQGLRPLSANTKLSYRMFLNEYLRAQGYVPNNGYSFTKNKAPAGSPRAVIQRDPVLLYQDATYGFTDDYVDCYGAGAVGTMGSHIIYNIGNREQYASRLLGNKPQAWFAAHSDLDVANKGIIYFPYRGFLDKSRVEWDKVHPETRTTLDKAVSCGLAVEHDDSYTLTDAGWLFAVNLMYSLMPLADQVVLSNLIAHSESSADRTPDDVILISPRRTITPARTVA